MGSGSREPPLTGASKRHVEAEQIKQRPTVQAFQLCELQRDVLRAGSESVQFEGSSSAVSANTDGVPASPDTACLVIQTGILNASVHSSASKLEIDLTYGRNLTLRVKDNGAGIDPVVADQGKQGHFGLQGMRERAARIGGTFILTSSPDVGTKIRLVVPGNIIF